MQKGVQIHNFENTESWEDKASNRQTILVYFAWPTKRPGGHQSQLTISNK